MNLFPQVDKGQWAENLACRYLKTQGLCLLERNYRCKTGEVDLIMQYQQILVFVEVRYRASQRYGGGIASVDFRKQQHILATAAYYLQTHRQVQQSACRFDVVLINGEQKTPSIQWIADAFRG